MRRLTAEQKRLYRIDADEFGRWTAVCPVCSKQFATIGVATTQIELVEGVEAHMRHSNCDCS